MAVTYVVAVTFVVGLALFVIPPFGQMPLAYQLALTGAALALWSFSDGFLRTIRIALALIEAMLLLSLAVSWTPLLVDVFGPDAIE